ncbi:PadR family transcriptional regulator [Propionicimonas sp.]|uniref:PadR family transcriptional regulator n=1 Tax=Propionicimonas sp. TaxID=1955623 RepID=UPI0039E50E73
MNDNTYDENWNDDPRAHRRGGHHGGRGRGRDFGPGAFGPGGFGPAAFGMAGPFGPGGPFGPNGPMGPAARGRGRGRRGHVRTAILALLADEPLNGYQVMQTLAERTQGMWRPSPGAVYPALSQLEDEGLIESFDNEGQKAFRLTGAGRAAAEQVETPPWEMVNEAVAGWGPDQVKGMWKEFASVAAAAKELTRNGDPRQVEAATALLADTRRKLYGLLASDGTGDVHNGDDLR